jgi:hypothetical protein
MLTLIPHNVDLTCHPGSDSCPHGPDCPYLHRVTPLRAAPGPTPQIQVSNKKLDLSALLETPSTPRNSSRLQNAVGSPSLFGDRDQSPRIPSDGKSAEAVSWISMELPLHHPRPQNPQNPLDNLRLSPFQLVPKGRSHRATGSSDSNMSIMTQESEGVGSPRRTVSRGTKQSGSRRGSGSGKYAVASIPPFKGSSPASQPFLSSHDTVLPQVPATEDGAHLGATTQPSGTNPLIVQTRQSKTLEDLLGISSTGPHRRPAKASLDSLFPSNTSLYDSAPKDILHLDSLQRNEAPSPLAVQPDYSLNVQSVDLKNTRSTRLLTEKTPVENVGIKKRSLFGQATAALVQNAATSNVSNPSKLVASNEGFSNANSLFSMPLHTFPPVSNHRKTLSKSSSSSSTSQILAPLSYTLAQEPVSPAASIATTHLSPRPPVLESVTMQPGHAFTDPSRPLFSGYGLSPVSDGGSSSSGGSSALNNWAKKQRDKDLRQAQRLEKALEEKISRLVRQLEWKPPVKREVGYGYGDGGEVPLEVTLPSGETMKVLSLEERRDMEAEVLKAESSLSKVRQEITQYGGTAGISTSYFARSGDQESPSGEYAKSSEVTPSIASPPLLFSSTAKIAASENMEQSYSVSRPSESLLFSTFTSENALFAPRGDNSHELRVPPTNTAQIEPVPSIGSEQLTGSPDKQSTSLSKLSALSASSMPIKLGLGQQIPDPLISFVSTTPNHECPSDESLNRSRRVLLPRTLMTRRPKRGPRKRSLSQMSCPLMRRPGPPQRLIPNRHLSIQR